MKSVENEEKTPMMLIERCNFIVLMSQWHDQIVIFPIFTCCY